MHDCVRAREENYNKPNEKKPENTFLVLAKREGRAGACETEEHMRWRTRGGKEWRKMKGERERSEEYTNNSNLAS